MYALSLVIACNGLDVGAQNDTADELAADPGEAVEEEPEAYDVESGEWSFSREDYDDECNVDLNRRIEMELEADDDEVVLFADDDGMEADREGNAFAYDFDTVIDGDDYGFDCVFTYRGAWTGEFTSATTALLYFEATWEDDGGRDCDDITLQNQDDEEIEMGCESVYEYEGGLVD